MRLNTQLGTFPLADGAMCLREFMGSNAVRFRELPTVERTIVSAWGREKRTMAKADLNGKPVYIQTSTLTIYAASGECLSSSHLRMEA
jgi:hypothetical protein